MKKDILLVVLVLICGGLLALVLAISEKENKVNKSLEEERYSRMVAEESSQKNAAKISTLEAQLKAATEKMNKVQDLISQQKNVNVDLQKQYDDLNKAKADLEDKLRTILEDKAIAAAADSSVSGTGGSKPPET